ncbi:MAG: histidine kinase dimerization/phosphoacceptor domain -containing protein [Oceanicaulis sp.]
MELKAKRGLRIQLVGVLALALSPLLLLSAVQSFYELRDERRKETAALYSTALIASQDMEAALQRAAGVASTISSRSFAFLMDARGCRNAVRRIARSDTVISNIALVDGDGRVMCSAIEPDGEVDVARNPWFGRLRAGEDSVFSSVYFGSMSRRPVIVSGQRMEGADGAFLGAVAVAVDLRAAARLLREDFLPPESTLSLINREGVVRLSEDSVTMPDFDDALAEGVLDIAAEGEPVRVPGDAFAPGYAVIVAALVPGQLGVLVAAPVDRINAWGGLSVLGTLLIPTIMWLMALASVWIAMDLFVLRWLTYLRRMARLYGGGRFDLPARRARSAPFEVRELADTMERMAASLDQQTRELEDVVEQRGALLREIHHRVKNNLQIIVSLLNLQAGRLEDEGARAALYEARRRINALAMVHRSLYEAEDLRYVEMRPFLQELVRNLADVSRAGEQVITAEVKSDPVSFPPDKAAPLALFVTEAITNAYKHAFVERESGRIEIALSCREGRCVVEVTDDGSGAVEDARAGTGSSLMRAFATQLGGQVENGAGEAGGHRAVLTFPME